MVIGLFYLFVPRKIAPHLSHAQPKVRLSYHSINYPLDRFIQPILFLAWLIAFDDSLKYLSRDPNINFVGLRSFLKYFISG